MYLLILSHWFCNIKNKFLDADNIVENILTSKLNNYLAICNMCAAGDTETNWNSIFKEISFRKARTYFMKNLHKCMQVLFHLFMLYCIVYCIIVLWRSHVKRIFKGTALRDRSGWGSFNRSTLKSQARGFRKNRSVPHLVRAIYIFSGTSNSTVIGY